VYCEPSKRSGRTRYVTSGQTDCESAMRNAASSAHGGDGPHYIPLHAEPDVR